MPFRYVGLVVIMLPLGGFAAPVAVPPGSFNMGCSVGDDACESDEGPVGGTPVHVPGFRIDRYEVRVDEFRSCVSAGSCGTPLTHADNKYCNYAAHGRDDHPVNCVDWDQAAAYCAWRSGRLPLEAEWEKAARAGSLTRFPWGEQVSCGEAILDDGVTTGSAGDERDGCGEDRTWAVGSRGVNALDLFDMHGNVGEWTANWYAPDAIAAHYANGDLTGPGPSPQRVVRGGSWDEDRMNLRSSFRNTKPPAQNGAIYGSIGFRCAYDNL